MLAEVDGASVYLEEYARGQIGQEEQHALEQKNVKGLCVRLSYKDCGKIGFTCSTFDLLHAGHITMLEEAKHHCDYLIVGLQTDPTIDRPDTKNQPYKV